MTMLRVYPEGDARRGRAVEDFDAIASELHAIGVRFERWTASRELGPDASQEDVLSAYGESVDRLMREYDFKSADVISLRPDHPDRVALRNKFLDEHIHTDFEVRFFVEGRGLFYIHSNNHVYGVLCERGDLISVPANTRHWFDMGGEPSFKCIRLFTTPEGWVAQYTGDTIAKNFPRFEQFVAA